MDTTIARNSANPTDRDRTLVRLFMDLWRETSTLVHDEVELARVEVSEKVSQVSTGAAVIATAAAVLFAGFLLMLLAAVNAVALAMPEDLAGWLAPLLVGAVVMIIGFIALAKGRANLRARNLKPERTVGALRSDRDLIKEHV
jgi:uncharacterized membrane protein YgdD (TMEM256/DUF423 family)